MMPKQKYWLYGILILAVIGIVLISGCIQEEGEKVETEPSTEVEVYKGIWLPTILAQDPSHLASNIQKLKDVGVNTVFLQGANPQAELFFQGAPPEELEKLKEFLLIEKELMIDNIQTAHRNGLKVALTLGSKPAPKLEKIDVEAWNSKIIEYAKLAEEYDVELFAPLNEPGCIFEEKVGEWRQEILPRIKEVYHGEVIWKGGNWGLPDKILSEEFLKELSEGPPGDFSGYDYIGFACMLWPEGQTLEEYSEYVENVLKYAPALAEKDNCKGVMVVEFGVLEGGPWSEEEIARAHEIVLEKAKGKVVGFFVGDFLEVEIPGVAFRKEALKTEEVIRKWYKEILP